MTPAAFLISRLECCQSDLALLEDSRSCLNGYKHCINFSSDNIEEAISSEIQRGWKVAGADTGSGNVCTTVS